MNGPNQPYGKYIDESGVLRDHEEEQNALKQAEFYIYSGCSMTSVRNWLVNKTGRYISTQGLLKAIKYDPSKRYVKYGTANPEEENQVKNTSINS